MIRILKWLRIKNNHKHISSFYRSQSESKSSAESRSSSEKQSNDIWDLKLSLSPSPWTDKFEKNSINDIPNIPFKFIEHIYLQENGSAQRFMGKQVKCSKCTEKV